MGVNCFNHPIFYGANSSSHHVIRSWVLTVLATRFCVVLTVQVTMFLAFSRVLTVLATLFRTVLTVQATMFLAFSRVLSVLATLFRTVLTVQATTLLLVM